MTHPHERMERLLEEDRRFKLEAYDFVRKSLAYAQDVLELGGDPSLGNESHLTGQQLCDAIRLYALDEYGYMAKVVLNSWGVQCTGDFGDIVYNMIEIGLMKKSKNDQREHFDEVFDFDQAFLEQFEIQLPD